MILADTSVWIDHLRRGNARLRGLLEEGRILCHPFVQGELACGTLRQREEILTLLAILPSAVSASHAEVLGLLGAERLHGSGLGWIDAHLLASTRLSGCALWTLDRALARAAAKLGIQEE